MNLCELDSPVENASRTQIVEHVDNKGIYFPAYYYYFIFPLIFLKEKKKRKKKREEGEKMAKGTRAFLIQLGKTTMALI